MCISDPFHRFQLGRLVCLALIFISSLFLSSAVNAEDSFIWPLGIKHVGAVYIEAEVGELEVDVFKKDLASAPRNQRMRIFLSAPDGRLVDEFVLPAHDFGQNVQKDVLGPVQRHVLRTKVKYPGIYTLLVTFEEYRYGEGAVWGFKTNASRYMLDAGSGHKGGTRNERIIMDNPGVPGEICFIPESGDFKIELANLPKDMGVITLLDAEDTLVSELNGVDGEVSVEIAKGIGNRDGVWRLRLPSQEVTAEIEGVTKWRDADSGERELALWTTSRDHYFDLEARYRLLRPRHLMQVLDDDQKPGVRFTVYNSVDARMEIALSPHQEGLGTGLTSELNLIVQPSLLFLEPKEEKEVFLSYDSAAVPSEGLTLRLQADAHIANEAGDHFSTYSTVDVRHRGSLPASVTPLQLKPWVHEEQLFGYAPEYPVDGEPYFSPENVAWMIADDQLLFREKSGEWGAVNVSDRLTQLHGGKWQYSGKRIGFDQQGGVYAALRSGARFILVRLAEGGEIFDSVMLPQGSGGGVYVEAPSLFASTDGPPMLYRLARISDRPRVPGQRWGRNHRLELLPPRFEEGRLTIGEPINVSDFCVGIPRHSGTPHSVISNGEKIHVVWGETSAADDSQSGVPTYAATWDRSGNQLGDRQLLGYAPPVNDAHNGPSMVMDSKGYLHTVLGSHNQSFQYTKSLEPDSTAVWSPATQVAPRHSQTYAGLAIDLDDTLHLVYREWRRAPIFPELFDAALFYQRKEAGKKWSTPEPLILPPLPHYSIWYQRLTTDRSGRLFLSYNYWSTWIAYRSVEREGMAKQTGIGRKLLFSDDAGKHWALARNADFAVSDGRDSVLASEPKPRESAVKDLPKTILFEESFDSTDALAGWYKEGSGQVVIDQGQLHLTEAENGLGITFWLDQELPESYLIEFDLSFSSNRSIGVFFFSANEPGEGLIETSPNRNGKYSQYINGDISTYGVSLHRYFPDGRNNPGSNLRQSPGFHLINQALPDPILESGRVFRVSIAYVDREILIMVDGKSAHRLTVHSGDLPILSEGFFGIRVRGHSSSTMFVDNLKIWDLSPSKE